MKIDDAGLSKELHWRNVAPMIRSRSQCGQPVGTPCQVSSRRTSQLGLNALHGFGADTVRLDRAAEAAPGQEIAADRGFLLGGDPRPTDMLALRLRARHAGLDALGYERTFEFR